MLAQSERHTEAAKLVASIIDDASASAGERCESAEICATAAVFADDIDHMGQIVASWYEALPTHSPLLHLVGINQLALLTLYRGSPEQARYGYAQIDSGDEQAGGYALGWRDWIVGISYIWEGHVELAAQKLRVGLGRAEVQSGRRSPIAVMLASALATALLECDRPEEAAGLLADRLNILERRAPPDAIEMGFVTAVRLALIAKTGEMGYPSVLSAKTWGFYDVLFKGKPFAFQRPYGSYVMENVLFKISFPAEFHSQTAVEAAMTLHQELAKLGRSAEDVKKITIRTHEACIRIIDKKGPLDNPADRDHCIQYMVAVPLIFGRLTAADYEDAVAKDPRIDALREKIVCVEDPRFTKDYHDPDKRSIANALTLEFKDGKKLKEVVVEYPIGHKRRRKDGIPLLVDKFKVNLARVFPAKQIAAILDVSLDQKKLEAMPVHEYVDLLVRP